jgi:UDP-4-amino-4-deoxy-L-arabinose formyltransferase / UDP-glucuronic acid dehydrogenase (UDP-4-keto-hexauronic acid decarboxylating)
MPEGSSRAVVLGYGEMATIGLQCLREAAFDVSLFVTHEDTPGETIWWQSPAAWAREQGIEVVTPGDANDMAEVARIRSLAPDFLFSFYYRSMIGRDLLAIPRRGALNLHGSLLPRYRGRAPINWVLVNGERETGVTLHYMDEKPDHGDIVLQRAFPIDPADTGLSLFRKAAAQARRLLREALPMLAAGTAPRAPQDHARASYFGRRRPEDGRIEWSWDALRVYNLVRAVTRPFPGAFTTSGGRKIFLWWGRPARGGAEGERAAPGTILGPRDGGVGVATGNGTFVVLNAQPEGGAAASDEDALAAFLPAGTLLPS